MKHGWVWHTPPQLGKLRVPAAPPTAPALTVVPQFPASLIYRLNPQGSELVNEPLDPTAYAELMAYLNQVAEAEEEAQRDNEEWLRQLSGIDIPIHTSYLTSDPKRSYL